MCSYDCDGVGCRVSYFSTSVIAGPRILKPAAHVSSNYPDIAAGAGDPAISCNFHQYF